MTKTIIESFEEQVLQTPHALALIVQDKEITYEELNYKANTLASYLLEHYEIGRDTIIALFLEKSEFMIVAILAVLKTGSAYLPLDTSYPKERIVYMLDDSRAKLLLSDTINKEVAKALGVEFFCVEELPNTQTENLNCVIKPSDLAYLIYTSGTTGKPKGVMVEIAGFVNMIAYQIESFHILPQDRIIQFASFSFDASVYETFLALLAGATFVIVKKEELLENFVAISKKYQVNVAVLNPSFLANVEELENFKVIITAGEKAIVSDALRYAKKCTYINAYGPTEASICSTFYKVDANKKYSSIPIGKDIINSKIYILDENLHEVHEGEIYISGKGLARGYLGQEQLTKEKFIEHPQFGRIYKSGDIGKFLEDGNIEYLGRVDEQVKIRGFRIELGEIENTVLLHNDIKECVVLAKNGELFAYYIGDGVLLESYLKDTLPSYMVPNHFIPLENFPLTPNGKVDKKALYNLEILRDALFVAPTNEKEKNLCNFVAQILSIDTISTASDIFSLGFDSIKAMVLLAKIRAFFGVNLTIQDIYNYPNVVSLASKLEQGFDFAKIENIPLEEYYELSHAQQRLWILCEMEKDFYTYNLPSIIEVKEPLDKDILEKAFNALLLRHESLRTNFIIINNTPKQIITPYKYQILEQIENIEQEAKKVFDLQKDVLIEMKIIDTKTLFLNMHHIISDGWSMNVLTKELSELYSEFKENKPSALKPLKIDYKDYSNWHNTLLKNQEYVAQEKNYWLGSLEEYQKLNFPTDFPIKRSFVGKKVSFLYNMQKINTFIQKDMLFAFLVTLTNILLAKYSNQEDILIGIPVANRENELLFEQIGFYVNTLPLRVKLESQKSFQENLTVVKKTILEVLTHQNYPFDMIVNDMKEEKELSRNPLFNILTVLQNREHNLFSSYKEFDNESSKFDLTFNYEEVGENLELTLEYNTNLFKSATIERLLLNLETFISSLEPTKLLKDLEILSHEEKAVLTSFNNTKIEYPKDKTIVQLFENQVLQTPNNIAVIYEDAQLTYEQLNKKANQLAHKLLYEHNIIPDDLVAISLERSLEMIIGIMGILKSGAAYLPIDPSYPKERIEYLMQNSGAKTLLYKEDIANLEDYEDSNPKTNLTPTNLAYVIYTSGSTGNPKGVMIEHRGAINRIEWMQKEYNLKSDDIILQKTPYSFDVSVWELLLPLMHGVKQVIAKPEGHKDNNYLVELIKKESITFLHFVPSMLSAMLFTNGLQNCSSVKNIVCSGEALPLQTVEEFYRTIKHITLHNLYGPTEASIDVTSFICPRDTKLHSIPIGKPIANTQLYILDANQTQLPLGAIGELYIGGVGLARGYLNQPDLTSQKFINHSIHGRIYKSGDLAKYHDDGNIEYLGRVDDQVKIRGFRIELGEIENAIASYETIVKNVVVVKDEQLVAYVIGESKDLRDYLYTKLPSHMIPSYIIEVEHFAVTSNGKLDKKALPNPKDIQREKEIISASSQNEKMLLEIFQEVLNVENISVDDNFFFIGGDSIKAIQIISKLNSLGFALEIKDMFYHPTIHALSQILDHESIEILDQSKVVGRFKLIPIQKFFIENFKDINHFNQYLVLESKTALDFETLKSAFLDVIEHHDVLRSRFEIQEGEFVQIIEPSTIFELEHIFSKENMDAIIKEANSSFDITKGGLLKAILFERDTLFITAHHLIMDGISLRLLIEGIENRVQGKKLPQKTSSFQEWSEAIYDYAHSNKINKDYWIHKKPYKIFDTKIEAKVANKEQLKFTIEKSLINKDYKLSSILLLAFAKALYQRTNKNKFSVIMEGHGREDVLGLNISRTIGWFTTLFLSNIEYAEANITTQLESIENSIELLHNGFDYGILQYILEQNLEFEPEIAFNYLGEVNLQKDTIFNLKNLALSSSYKNDRVAPIEVESLIVDDLIVFIAFDNSLAPLFEGFDGLFKKELLSVMEQLNHNTIYNLTYPQKGLFLLDALHEDLSVYNETASFEFNENLDKNILQKSFEALLGRHAILRTGFLVVDGTPKQKVYESVNFHIIEEKLGNQNLQTIIESFDAIIFDIANPPLLRAKLVQLDSKKYVLILTFHHLIIDGWSLNVILHDLKEFYNSFVNQKKVNLQPLKAQYKDFVSFTHNLLKKSDTDKTFWFEKLHDIANNSYIPFDFENKKTHKGGLVRHALSQKLFLSLKQIAQKNNKTFFALLISLVDILLYLYSNEEQIIIATPVANARENEMFANQIGLYLNTLVLSSTLNPSATVRETLATVHEDILEAFNHQNYPYDKIIEDLKITKPLFTTMVILQNFEKKEFDFENLEFKILENNNYGSKFELKFEFEEKESLELMLEYSTDLFKKETIETLANNFNRLAEIVSRDADLTIEYLEKALQLYSKIEIQDTIDEDF